MPEPTSATTDKKTGNRTYFDPVTGRKLPSVTTILNVISKPHLYQWYAKMAGVRAVEEFDELERRLRLDGQEAARKWVSNAAVDNRDNAAVRGSDLHDLADRYQRGETLSKWLTDDTRSMLDGLMKFYEEQQPTFHHTEICVVNSSAAGSGYGGSADGIATLPKVGPTPMVVDYKTGRTGPYAEWALQLTAYAHGERSLVRRVMPGCSCGVAGCNVRGNGHAPRSAIVAEPMPEVSREQAAIIRILPGTYELWVANISELWRPFQAAIWLHRFESKKLTSVFTRSA